MKTILCVLLGLVVLSSGCAAPANPPAQNISTTEPVTPSSNISQNAVSPNISANVVWPDTASLLFAPENVLNINSLQVHASLFVRFSGNTALPNGTVLFSQLYEDGKACVWWPVNQPIKVENSFWTIVTPLGINGSPDALVPGPDYFFILYNDSIKAEYHFLLGSGPPAYAANTVSGNLSSNWQKTTISEIENSLGYKLPVPAYWPQKYEIKEVFSRLEPNSTPQITDILLLISDNPIEWRGSTYTTRLALNIGWNEASLGLKMPWAEFIPEVSGRLEQRDGQYILWWPSYGTPQSLGSTLRLFADLYFPKDEMIKIAASTPTTPAMAFTLITAPLTLDGTTPGTQIPWGSVVYHWTSGITEVYGPDNRRIFIAKDSEAAMIAHPTAGRGGSPSPATHGYQVPSGARIDSQAIVGTDKATKIYMGDQLILTVIEKTGAFVY